MSLCSLLTIFCCFFFAQENSELEFLVRLLGLAFKSLTLLETKEYYESKVVWSPSFFLSLSLITLFPSGCWTDCQISSRAPLANGRQCPTGSLPTAERRPHPFLRLQWLHQLSLQAPKCHAHYLHLCPPPHGEKGHEISLPPSPDDRQRLWWPRRYICARRLSSSSGVGAESAIRYATRGHTDVVIERFLGALLSEQWVGLAAFLSVLLDVSHSSPPNGSCRDTRSSQPFGRGKYNNWRAQNQSGLTYKFWVSPPNLENLFKMCSMRYGKFIFYLSNWVE